MSFLKEIEDVNDIVEDGDSLGPSFIAPSGLYDMIIDMAYVTKSSGGATMLNLSFKDKEYNISQKLVITSGDTKGNKNYYIDKKSGDKRHLPGFNIANAISLLSIGKKITSLDTEEKIVNRYNPEINKEDPQKTHVVVDLLDKPITIGIFKQTVNKYNKPNETFVENDVNKVFRTRDHLTVTEIKAGEKEPRFYKKWDEKYTGIDIDKSKKNKKNNNAASSAAKPISDLFADDKPETSNKSEEVVNTSTTENSANTDNLFD